MKVERILDETRQKLGRGEGGGKVDMYVDVVMWVELAVETAKKAEVPLPR